MTAWIKSLRLPVCFLAVLLTIVSFRLGGAQISWLVIFAVFFISCSTMLQNDWRDKYHDGRKGKILALSHSRAFLALLLVFWTVACGLIVVVAVKNSNVGMALVAMALVGLFYSETRRIPMVPVTLVAIASGSPALLSIVAGADGNKAWLLFFSATFIIFGREITKDIDDERIDAGYKWTIPLAVGNNWAKAIAIVTIIAGLAIATRISIAALPAMALAIVGVVLLTRNVRPIITRTCIDVGVALAILTIVFFG